MGIKDSVIMSHARLIPVLVWYVFAFPLLGHADINTWYIETGDKIVYDNMNYLIYTWSRSESNGPRLDYTCNGDIHSMDSRFLFDKNLAVSSALSEI